MPTVGVSSGEQRDVLSEMLFGPAVPVKSQSTPQTVSGALPVTLVPSSCSVRGCDHASNLRLKD